MNKDYLVVLDACVLVPASLRDTLLRLAETPRLYVPRWTDDVIIEMKRTLEVKLQKTPEQTAHLEDQTVTSSLLQFELVPRQSSRLTSRTSVPMPSLPMMWKRCIRMNFL